MLGPVFAVPQGLADEKAANNWPGTLDKGLLQERISKASVRDFAPPGRLPGPKSTVVSLQGTLTIFITHS